MTEKQSQRSGENSLNVQAGGDVSIGITYEQARQIAQDVFDANFLKLSSSAAELATSRAHALIEQFLKDLSGRHPDALNSARDPDMQYCMTIAQVAYARSGDKDLQTLLVDLLVDRATRQDRDLRQIVLNEALSVAPKLTSYQYDILSLAFMFLLTISPGMRQLQQLEEYIQRMIIPLIPALQKENSCYQHLEYAACVSIQITHNQLHEIFTGRYSRLFWRGVTERDLRQLEQPGVSLGDLIIPCLHDSSLYQLSPLNEAELRQECTGRGFPESTISSLVQLMKSNLMTEHPFRQYLLTIDGRVERLFDVWENSFLSRLSLTSVGIAIGNSNLRRKVGVSFDLANWIA